MRFSQAYLKDSFGHLWRPLEQRFRQFRDRPLSNQRIPKILHQIWLGSPLPDRYRQLIAKLRARHPDWEYRLWTDDDVDFDFDNYGLFRSVPNIGQKSDILRYELLRRFGGVYLDLDFVALRSLNAFVDLECFAGVSYDGKPQLLNGLIGCSADSPLANDLCRSLVVRTGESPAEILDATGPNYFTAKFLAHLPTNEGIVAFPNAFFYPYPNFPKDRIYGEDYRLYLSEDSVCCHLWHCSWIKKSPRKQGLLERVSRMLSSFPIRTGRL